MVPSRLYTAVATFTVSVRQTHWERARAFFFLRILKRIDTRTTVKYTRFLVYYTKSHSCVHPVLAFSSNFFFFVLFAPNHPVPDDVLDG